MNLRRFLIIASIWGMPLCTAIAQQTDNGGQWSIMGNGGYNIPVSESMKGDATSFQSEVQNDYTFSQYPFGASNAFRLSIGGQLAWQFPLSSWSAVGGAYYTSFFTSTVAGSYASMQLWTLMLGSEYSVGTFDDQWSAFGRAGVNVSLIQGKLHFVSFFGTFDIQTNDAFRFGLEGEVGARYNLQSQPISIEASVNYTNANLIGKAFERPNTRPPFILKETELNDGDNPDDPNDGPKTIDFLSMRIGLRLRL